MSISYIITNNEELATPEELGTLKNEIEKQRLLKKHGKQEQDYLLEKQFKPITKAIKGIKSDPEKRLEEAQKEVEELEEQEIKNTLKRDFDYYSLSQPIKDLIENLLKTKHSQIKLSLNFIRDSSLRTNEGEVPFQYNEYFLNNSIPIQFGVYSQGEAIIFKNSGKRYDISPNSDLYFFLHPDNRNKPYNC